MDQVSDADIADTHMAANRSVNSNARIAVRLYEERFPNRYFPGHRIVTSLHQRLRDTGGFNANRMADGRSGRIRAEAEEEVLHHFRENPRASAN